MMRLRGSSAAAVGGLRPFLDSVAASSLLLALLLGSAVQHAHASCAVVKGSSNMFGDGSCGSWFDDGGRDTKAHIKEVQAWYGDGCLMGLRTVLTGGGAGTVERMYGMAVGSSQSLTLAWDEFLTGADIKVSRCIDGLKLSTSKGQSITVGGGGGFVARPSEQAYIFGFKGKAGDCGISQLGLIWAVEDCNAGFSSADAGNSSAVRLSPTSDEAAPPPGGTRLVYVPVPVPVPSNDTQFAAAPAVEFRPQPVPLSIPIPVINPTAEKLEIPIIVPKLTPVPTPLDIPVPTIMPKVTPVPTPLEIPVPQFVPTPKPVPTPIDVPFAVPVPRPVPVPTPVDVPTPTPVPTPRPVPVPQPAEAPPAPQPGAPTILNINNPAVPGNNIIFQQGPAEAPPPPGPPSICNEFEDLVIFTAPAGGALQCQAGGGGSSGTLQVSDWNRLSNRGYGWLQSGAMCVMLGCDEPSGGSSGITSSGGGGASIRAGGGDASSGASFSSVSGISGMQQRVFTGPATPRLSKGSSWVVSSSSSSSLAGKRRLQGASFLKQGPLLHTFHQQPEPPVVVMPTTISSGKGKGWTMPMVTEAPAPAPPPPPPRMCRFAVCRPRGGSSQVAAGH